MVQEARDGKDDERDCSDGACDLLDGTADAKAVPLQGAEDEEEDERDGRLRVEELRKERGEIFGCSHGGERDDSAVVEPVSPSHGEAGGGTEGALGVDVEASRLGHGGTEFGDGVGAEQSVRAADDPDEKDGPEAAHVAGDHAGEAQDADADRASEDDGDSEAKAENSSERLGARDGAGVVRWVRQRSHPMRPG